ncbi:MAG TPA: hypothetical protein VFE98_03545 [Candidatus Bathyarchaeia archaeon]|nr:hypothetical protein [Candidatus Bathyarchaeia archaeon]
MTRQITTVKKEIRILGIDTCNPKCTIGAVVRGGYWLDGIILLSQRSVKDPLTIAETILGTRYYAEVRSIMTHDAANLLDPEVIEKVTRLPVIQVSTSQKPGNYSRFYGSHGKLWVKTKIPGSTLEKIVAVTWTARPMPEPVRLAHLLSRTRSIPPKPR